MFLLISKNGESLGRLEFLLYMDKVPKTAEHFRSLCTGDNKYRLTYERSAFHAIYKEMMVIGGDVENYDGTGCV